MNLFKTHLSPALFLVVAVGYTGTVLYENLNKTQFKHSNSIVFQDTNGSIEYQKFRHLDGNLDGVVTKLEVDLADQYKAPMEAYKFAETLSLDDQRLVYGLSFNVAQQAVSKLNKIEKSALLKINLADRVNLMNARFA